MIREEIKKQLIEAMKAGQKEKVDTLRLINSTIKDKDIADRTKGNMDGISDDTILSVLQGMIKQRKESIALYTQGNRPELAAAEQKEVDIIQAFLPKQMTPEEMREAIKATIDETGAAGMKDMGKVMGLLRSKYAGKMDFAAASGEIKALLAG
ncbi:MAG: GatB/YqeY domain-containing protein [Alphaproteobacteria bacterium]